MNSIRKFIEKKLKLKVNEEKSKVAKTDKVKFLGMTIVNGTIATSKKSFKKAMETVRNFIPRGTNISIEQAMTKINRWYSGWVLLKLIFDVGYAQGLLHSKRKGDIFVRNL